MSSNPLTEASGGRATNGSGGSSGATGGTVASGGTATGGSATGGSDEPGMNGDYCGRDEDCESGFCTDGVCCESECNGSCERCSPPDGRCRRCPAGSECTEGECLLSVGQACEDGSECALSQCVATRSGGAICCGSRCNGMCEACGSDGMCDDYPATDDSCDPVMSCAADTPCVTYRLPEPNECSERGKCAQCEPTYSRRGVPCGVGSECDGSGECIVNGIGRVAAGERHTCAITISATADKNGNVVCWGDNGVGQLGAAFHRPEVGVVEVPAVVPGLEINFEREVWRITAGKRHTCVLFDDGGVRCWGSLVGLSEFANPYMILGTSIFELTDDGFVNPLAMAAEDVRLPNPKVNPAVQISAAPDGATICARLLDGKVSCWGDNRFGQLGLGDTAPVDLSDETLPAVELDERVVDVRSGSGHTCVRTESDRVQCWGRGTAGQLGYANIESLFLPKTGGDSAYVDIGGFVTDLAVGRDYTCVILESGAVRCWGANDAGQLGYGHTQGIGANETPAEAADGGGPPGRTVLGGDVDFGGIAMEQIVTLAESRSTCVLSADNAVRCWGENGAGQLGYGHFYDGVDGAMRYTPFQLERDITIDGGVPWGGPVRAGGTILALAEGGRCALATGGSLRCWGDNEFGQTGLPEGRYWSRVATPEQFPPVHWWAGQ